MPIPAVRLADTVYICNPAQMRWFEIDRARNELTLYYNDGTMETLRHDLIENVYNDLKLQFTIIEP